MRKPYCLAVPQTRAEILQHELTTVRPAFRIDLNAFTDAEKLVFSTLLFVERPMTLHAIYFQLAPSMVADISTKRGDKKAIEKFFNELTIHDGKIKRTNMKTGGIIRAVHAFNQKYDANIPSYKTVRRICDDFYEAKLLGRREIGKRKLYYIPSELLEKYKQQFPPL